MVKQLFKRLRKAVVTGEAAGRATDPAFYNALQVLPNPDPVLRAMGRAEQTYDAIISDAHIIGDLRSVRAGLLSYKHRIVAGKDAKDTPQQKLAMDLCTAVMARPPAPGMLWQDTLWNMATAVLRGFRVHELVWELQGDYLLPDKILDRPNRRFKFDTENNLRLLTKANPSEGEATEDYKYLVTRHMPSIDNPYGQALLSSCFWPYTFKHGGFKFYYQFTERYGMPWPIGKYAKGATVPEQNELIDALSQLLQSGVAAIPEDDSVELLTLKSSGSGEPVQERLINLCNREMSKAITSQTLATDVQSKGSFAASKTHRDREQSVNTSDRRIIEATMNQMFALITRFNCGEDVIPPVFEMYKEKEPTEERSKMWEAATRIGKPSLSAYHKEMNIPQAVDENDVMSSIDSTASNFTTNKTALSFNTGEASLQQQAIDEADQAIDRDFIEPVLAMLEEYERQGKTLQQFLDDMPGLYNRMDETELTELTSLVLRTAMAEGLASA
ncbi:MAG: DUF935 domain-containing protein [Pseudomonadales bacterium]